MPDAPTITVQCPHCQYRLEVNPASGEVVAQAEPVKPKKSLSDLLAEQETAKDKRSQAYRQSLESEQTKAQRLKEQVRKALDTIKPEDIKPELRDFDLD